MRRIGAPGEAGLNVRPRVWPPRLLTVRRKGRTRHVPMGPYSLNDVELSVLRDVLEAAYRRQHRETWEVEVSGAPQHLAPAKHRQEILAALLKTFGSSGDSAMRNLRGDGLPPEV